MGNVVLFNPADNAIVTMDWSDVLGTAGVTLSNVTHTVPAPLSKTSEATGTTSSQVKISGAVHGKTYLINGAATLSNGELINREFAVRGWNA